MRELGERERVRRVGERRRRRKKCVWEVESYLVFHLRVCSRGVHMQHFWQKKGGGREKFGCKKDVRQGACLLGSVTAYFKEGIGVPEVCFAWLKHEQCVCVCALSSEWLICDVASIIFSALPPFPSAIFWFWFFFKNSFFRCLSGCSLAYVVSCCLQITNYLSEVCTESWSIFYFNISIWMLSHCGPYNKE